MEEWKSFDQVWQKKAEEAALKQPLKRLLMLPQNMPGMTEETAKWLKMKALKWIVVKDVSFSLLRKIFCTSPLKRLFSYLRSFLTRKPFKRRGDFFFYGLGDEEAFLKLKKRPKTLFVLGFSYCHKPFECPSGRFSDGCIRDEQNPICQQCFIQKAASSLERTAPLSQPKPQILIIPTVHYVGEKMVDLVAEYPGHQILFLITACEMTLTMFADFGNMLNIKGIGVRLDGRICNTMRAFELSEQGIKPGLTVVLEETKEKMLDLIRR